MSTKKRLITTIIVLVIVIGSIGAYLVWTWVFRQADSSVAGQKAEIEITAPSLLSAFETNENMANQKYNGKVIAVSGTISEIKEDPQFISVYLKDSAATAGVMCSFDKNVVKLQDFKTGQKIKLKGICTGYLMDAVLNKCALDN